MGGVKIRALVALLVVLSACEGVKNNMKMVKPQPTTTTTMLTASVMVEDMRPSPNTLPLPTAAAPVCPEASSLSPLSRLRKEMKNAGYTQTPLGFDAFLVFSSDEHLSDEPAPEERRLEYISGWDGVGTAAVMAEPEGGAALWVHSGDLTRARMTVSCAWTVLDMDDWNNSIPDWIAARLGRTGRVGGDARLTSVDEWQAITLGLQQHSKSPSQIYSLNHVPTLVDQLWAEEPDADRRRPEFSKIVANLHNPEYTGVTWREKLSALRKEINISNADAMVVTALDEVAWLLNVRGKDTPYAPLLKAFVVITMKDVKVYIPAGKFSMPVREALQVYSCYANNDCTRIIEYSSIYSDLRRMTESRIIIPSASTFHRGASAAIFQSVPQNKRLQMPSPIIDMKAQKNKAEIKGMNRAHLRDAVAMCTLLSYLEGMVKMGLTELSVGMKVDLTRVTQARYVGVSMATRIAFGRNGADPDYRPDNFSNSKVLTNSTLIIRSGGQYDEGTTVVTRTVHYGTPTREMRTAYTTVLRSLAAMSTLQIPETLPAAHTDPVVRAPLWAANQDYPHPTGHGVGAALNRREDPVVIDYRQDMNLHTFKQGYFIMVEPAWYERGKFGVRLGNVLEVEQRPERFLGFKEATLVPFEPKLIDRSMLTEYEMKWINAYNERIRKIVGPELKDQGLTDVYYWMSNKTVRIEPAKPKSVPNGATMEVFSWALVVATFVLLQL